MADHTDFIRIRGLESSDDEVFQGLGAAAVTVEGPGGTPGTSPGIEWGEIPAEVLEQVGQYTTDLNSWIAQALRYDPDTGSRALVPELLDDLPIVPLVTSIVATGGVSLPAVAATMLTQVLMNQIGSAVANYAESLDQNSPTNILKKAFLWDNNGTMESILGTAMLRVSDDEKSILRERLTALIAELTNTTGAVNATATAVTTLEQPLKDLSLIDLIIQFGDDLKARIKGKALEF